MENGKPWLPFRCNRKIDRTFCRSSNLSSFVTVKNTSQSCVFSQVTREEVKNRRWLRNDRINQRRSTQRSRHNWHVPLCLDKRFSLNSHSFETSVYSLSCCSIHSYFFSFVLIFLSANRTKQNRIKGRRINRIQVHWHFPKKIRFALNFIISLF